MSDPHSLSRELLVEYLRKGKWFSLAWCKQEKPEQLEADAEALSKTPEKYVYSMHGKRRVSYRERNW